MGTKRKSLRKRKLFRSRFENQWNFFFFASLSRNGLFKCHSQRDVLVIAIRSSLPDLSSMPLGSSGLQSDLQSVDFVEIKAELLEEENIQIPSWMCFSSVDGLHASSGESFNECFDILNKCDKVNVVGINCTPSQFIGNLICKFREVFVANHTKFHSLLEATCHVVAKRLHGDWRSDLVIPVATGSLGKPLLQICFICFALLQSGPFFF